MTRSAPYKAGNGTGDNFKHQCRRKLAQLWARQAGVLRRLNPRRHNGLRPRLRSVPGPPQNGTGPSGKRPDTDSQLPLLWPATGFSNAGG